MKTATLDAGGMLSMLDYQCVEKQLRRLPVAQMPVPALASLAPQQHSPSPCSK